MKIKLVHCQYIQTHAGAFACLQLE